MWFKQAQLFKLENSLGALELEGYLEQLPFTPCPSGLPISQGWISPTDEEAASLVYTAKEFLLVCLQTEAKLLPAKILRQKLNEKVKEIQLAQDRKVSYKEKNSIKQEVYNELLPKAFGVIYRDYAIIDTKNNWLILGTTNAAKTEQFISLFKRSVSEKIRAFEFNKPSPIITHWLKNKSNPIAFSFAST